MKTLGCLVLAAAGLCPGQSAAPPPLTREGAVWSFSSSGAFPCGVRGQLKVATHGDIVLRGVSRDDCGFRIKQSARAGSEREARRKLTGFATRAKLIADTAVLNVVPAEIGRAHV